MVAEREQIESVEAAAAGAAGVDDKRDKLATPARIWRLSRRAGMCWDRVSRFARGVNDFCLWIASLPALCRTGTVACILTFKHP
jgi:hypothetical protein